MELRSTFRFFEQLKKDDLSFIYQGNFNDDITNRVIDLSERNMDSQGQITRLRHRVSFLLAECFQNIVRHGETKPEKAPTSNSRGIFITRHQGDCYYIISGNLVSNNIVEDLTEKLNNINSMSKEELKKLYMRVLANEGLSEKGGAGLGLIEMARKSGEKLDYDFERINDELSFFYLQVKLRGKNADMPDVAVSNTREVRQNMEQEDILMIHRGDFNQDTIIPVLRMIENNIQDQFDKFSLKKMVYHVMVEVLQNISHHAKLLDNRRDGIFLLGRKGEHYMICTGNFIDNSEIEGFERQLKVVNQLDRPGLKELYKKTLREGRVDENGGAGLGLIDIRRDSSDKLEYDFMPVDENTSFFSLSVTI